MKLNCAYCGSYVEVDENCTCPMCGAPMGEAVKAEEERQAKAAAEEQARLEQEAAEQAQQEQTAAIISGIAGIAGSILGASSAKKATRPPRHLVSDRPPQERVPRDGRTELRPPQDGPDGRRDPRRDRLASRRDPRRR